jgi:hypothetical protein
LKTKYSVKRQEINCVAKKTKVFIFGGDFILPPLIRILEGATMEKLSQIISGIIFGAISWIVLYQYFFIGG